MEHVLEHSFLPEKYLEIICGIPHGSYHEKPLSDYLVSFAKEHNLRYKQYPNWNVIIYKQASPGYENHEPVMLQAHIDMVCEAEAGYEHDFEKDPLDLYIEDGFLHARGTTLGADDGVGVAYMLALLEDDKVEHPPLECVFTVQEEVGLIGSKDLAYEDIHARRMIGLDDTGGSTCYVSACGSQHMLVNGSYSMADNSYPGYCITIEGLLGGHSGVCINKERGNAIKLMARVLYTLADKLEIQLGSIIGGGKDNVIPTTCTAVITGDINEDLLFSTVENMNRIFKRELEFSDPDVSIKAYKTNCDRTLSRKDSKDFIHFLYILPDGLRHKSMKIENLTTVSENFANIRMDDGDVKIRYFARSELDSYLDFMAEEIKIISHMFGFYVELLNRAPGWKYEEKSEVRRILFEAYHSVTGEHMKELAEHGGLEAGYISGGIPGIDIATCGPYIEGFHTPGERLDLASFRVIYEVLKRALLKM